MSGPSGSGLSDPSSSTQKTRLSSASCSSSPDKFFSQLTQSRKETSRPPSSQSRKADGLNNLSPKTKSPALSSNARAGPSTQTPNSQRPSLTQKTGSSSSTQSRLSKSGRSFTNRPTVPIDLTITNGDKGKGKLKEPIDLTISDTDDETIVVQRKELNQSILKGSSGSIVLLDKDMVSSSQKSKDKGKGREIFRNGMNTPTSTQTNSSRIIPNSSRTSFSISPRKKPNSHSTRTFNPKGLSPQKPIDLCSNSSGSSPLANIRPLQAIENGIPQQSGSGSGSSGADKNGNGNNNDSGSSNGNGVHDGNSGSNSNRLTNNVTTPSNPFAIRTISRTNSNNSITISPQKRVLVMPRQSTKPRMSAADREVALAVRKKEMEERKKSQEPRNGNSTPMQRTISQESIGSALGLKLGSASGSQISKNSPLRNINSLLMPNGQSSKTPLPPPSSQSASKSILPSSLGSSSLDTPSKAPTQSTQQPSTSSTLKGPLSKLKGAPKSTSLSSTPIVKSVSSGFFTPKRTVDTLSEAGPSKPTLSPTKSKHFLPTPQIKISHSQSSGSKTKQPAPEEEEDEDEQSYRPKSTQRPSTKLKSSIQTEAPTQSRTSSRSRPEPGAYTLPALDTNIHDWPRINSTHSAGGSMRKPSGSKPNEKGKPQEKNDIPDDCIVVSMPTSTAIQYAKKNDPSKVSTTKKSISSGKSKSSTNKSKTSKSTDMKRTSTGSSGSTLTPIPSRSTTPSLLSSTTNKKKGYKPSPVKSLSASPIKGKPFPRLFGDETPISKSVSSRQNGDKIKDKEVEEMEVEQEVEMGDDDMFADFDNFQWDASDEEEAVPTSDAVGDEAAVSNAEGSGDSTEKQQEVPTNKQSQPIPTEISGNVPPQPTSADTASPTTPRSSQKRPNPSDSPSSPNKRISMTERYKRILEDNRIEAEKEKEEAKEKERQLESGFSNLLGNSTGDEEKEEEGGDLAGFLDDIATRPKAPSPIKPNAKVAVQSRQEVVKARIEAEKQARRQAKLDLIAKAELLENAKKLKAQNLEFDKLLRYGQNLEIDLNEISMISDGNGNEGQNAYPTPETEFDEDLSLSIDEDDLNFNMDMDIDLDLGLDDELDSNRLRHGKTEGELYEDMVEELRKGGLNVDESLIRDAKASLVNKKGKKTKGLDWEGFWEKDLGKIDEKDQKPFIPFDINSDDPVLQMINGLIPRNGTEDNLDSLSTVISSGVLSFVDSGSREVGNALLINAVSSSNSEWSKVAKSTFVDLLRNNGYFQAEDLQSFVQFGSQLLKELGGRKSILEHSEGQSESVDEDMQEFMGVTIDRESGCALVCRILMAHSKSSAKLTMATEDNSSERPLDSDWIPILSLLSIDNSTSSALKRTIRDTVETLLQRMFSDSDNKPQLTRDIASSIAKLSEKYDNPVKSALLESLGEKCEENMAVGRWLAIQYLLPGTLDEVVKMTKSPNVPSIKSLLLSIEKISNLVKPSEDIEPNYDDINILVTFLYKSMSDIDTLLEDLNIDYSNNSSLKRGDKNIKDLMIDCEIERVREDLRRCRDRISDQSNGTLKAMVKARLHQLYEITRLTLNLSIKKRVRSQRLGKGLKAGTKGQSKLDFGVKTKSKVNRKAEKGAEDDGAKESDVEKGQQGGVEMEKRDSSSRNTSKTTVNGGIAMEKKAASASNTSTKIVKGGIAMEKKASTSSSSSRKSMSGKSEGVAMEKKGSKTSANGTSGCSAEDVDMILG